MKLTDEVGRYTKEGLAFNKKVHEVLEPLIEEAFDNGAVSPEVIYIVMGVTQLQASKYSVKKHIKRLKEEANKGS